MALEQAIITWIHLVCAAIWVGGSLFIAIVFAPLLKTMAPTVEERLQIMIKAGRRFNKIAIPSLVILIATGIFNVHQMILRPDFLLSTSYGIMVVIKIILVIALLISFGAHVRIIRKEVEQKIVQKQLSEVQIAKLRKKIIIVGETTVVISIAILFVAALLDAGI
ncbi:MAG: CopD family protein [Candidatus Nitrosotenuis sp.]|uniref:CopD family protein n=1 Tax=Candidatus Nitrosotenuis uzonensis TaxID=1407055 RepID=UPI001FCAB1DC|nr:CopD family protein [Candidatus Nitrosotenuis uzonensis]